MRMIATPVVLSFYCVLVFLSAVGNTLAGDEELLVNGDFGIGTPEDDKPDSFVCKGWRRLLWKETEPNSWLTCGERDWQVGKSPATTTEPSERP